MSDETPTQRFDATPDAPTERFDQTPGAGTAGGSVAPPTSPDRSRRLLIILASVGGALLLGVLILLVVLLTRGSADAPTGLSSETTTASASPTPTESTAPSPTPTPSETQEPPPPPDTGAKINSFTASNSEVLCNTQAPSPSPQYITFSWSSSNVDRVYFGINTNDASQGALFDNLPPTGDASNFPDGYYPFEYPCPSASTKFTLTVVGSDGSKTSKSVTITNTGDTQ